MSSILDALRKLQRDRESRDSHADLRHSVTLPVPSGGGRGRLLVGVLIVASLGVLAAWFYVGGLASRVGSGAEVVAAAGATEPPVPEPGRARAAGAQAEPAVAAPRTAPGSRAMPAPPRPQTAARPAPGPRVAASPAGPPPSPRDTPRPGGTPATTALAGAGAARAATTGRPAATPAPPTTGGASERSEEEQSAAEQIAFLEAMLKRAALTGRAGEIASAAQALEALRPTQSTSSEALAKASSASGRDPRGGGAARSVAPRTPPPTPTPSRAPERQVIVIPGRGDREPAPAPVRMVTTESGSARIIPASAGTAGSRPQQRPIEPPPQVESASASTPRPPAPLEPPELQRAGQGVAFPELRVESVRWHPEPERRVARVQLEEAGPLEVRQGDIVAGVLVTLIDPAAIEIQLGTSRKRVPLEP